jgi:F-type H+-transporting ATPase subunit delta
MTARTAATRYARALLDVASKEGADIDDIAREISEFAALLQRQPALDRVLMNPAVPSPRKRAAMVELVRLAGLSPVLSKLLILLAERDRLMLLNHVAAIYGELLMDRRNIVRAEVTTSTPLEPERVRALQQKLSAVTGKQVSMVTKVDASIMGGVIARVGSTVYDGSIATQLKKIRERLTT